MLRISVHRLVFSAHHICVRFPSQIKFVIPSPSKTYFEKETGLVFLYTGYRVSFSGAKRPERGVDHALQSGAEAKEEIDLYFYSLSGSSWLVLG
jgi:hypothetical protein